MYFGEQTVQTQSLKAVHRTRANELVNGALLWRSRGTDVCRRACWCATALTSLTHGHAAGGIIYYMENTIGFHVAGNGILTM